MMGIALDYTARIDPAALKAAGVTDVLRYISLPLASTAWKRIGLAEYRELLAAGIRVTLNWEYDAQDWLGGASAGATHAAAAVAAARALGYPAGRVIVGSADFNMTRAQWDSSGHAYGHAFATAVRAGGYRPGVYGPWDVLTWVRDAGLMDAFWQAGMSTSWSAGRNANAWPGAHLRQRGHKTVAGQDCDWNEILIPDWGADMTNLGYADNDGQFLCERERALLYLDKAAMGPEKGTSFPVVELLKRLDANLAALTARPALDVAALAAALAPLLTDHLGVEVSAEVLVAALKSDEGQAALVAADNKAEDS